LGVEAIVLMGDIGNSATVASMAAEAIARFGTIDILVNNAAIRAHKPFLEVTDEEWHQVFDTDLHAGAYLSRAFLPGMVAQKWGRIVNLTGRSAIAGASERAHVAAAKNALWGLTRALAREFGPHRITVNAVSPFMIGKGKSEPAPSDLSINAMGRKGKVTEVAAACGFLCSDEGAYISGQMIGVDGAAGG
jgi:3-oxoacyl-[acyl-carrier protein] reductase